MTKRTTLSALFALALLATVPQAQAQTDLSIGPRVGYETDSESFFVGGDARIGVETLPIRISPTFDYFFIDDVTVAGVEASSTLFQITGNALYEFGIDNTTFTPYAGAGLSYIRQSVDVSGDNIPGGSQFGGSSSEIGLNLLGGAEFTNVGGFAPFVQGEFVVGGDINPFKITGGLLFDV
jgi:opacity protein-like surface antigen